MSRFPKRHALDGLLLFPLFSYLFVLTGLPLLSCIVLSFTEGEARPSNGQKTGRRLDGRGYDPAIAHLVACMLLTPSYILNAK
jgi:ABC-type sugar transport system permease subunit